MPRLLRTERDGPILRITVDNPPANALSVAAIEQLQAELDAASADDDLRVVIIAAAGKLFSGGHDLKEMTAHRQDADGGRRFFEETFARCSRMMQSIVALPQPVIAEVDGIATAAGCQLVASCDLAYASDAARFGVNGIDVGLFCSTPAVALTRNIAMKPAMEMLLTGRMIDAATACEIGLINRAVPRESLRQLVDEVAGEIAGKSPAAIRLGKKTVYQQAGRSLADAYDCASRAIVDNMLAADAEEGIAAFFGKREPRWRQS
jgi:enoyl-CoA hydratase/carnithine racemase